jgi:hypothetical protein
MDKETLSNYGWIVIAVLVLVVMIALATPFGSYISEAVQSTTKGLFDVNKTALNSTGLINIDNQEFDVPDMNHGAGENGGGAEGTPVVPEENEPTTYTLSGRWVFKNTLTQTGWASGTDTKYQLINYTFHPYGDNNAVLERNVMQYGYQEMYKCTFLSLHNGGATFDHTRSYYHWFHNGNCSAAYNDGSGWNDSFNNPTVDFGNESQEVSEEFYNWFTANATQTF